ncbi:hypothetical protein FKV73_07720 [Weissella paramesenteroides]|nr:hypothetical protein FKV79_04090 [Weissella paramesenteroides]KAA8436677.1 hypothetical protein FKV73_07720 [Weissella paramesenteroides]
MGRNTIKSVVQIEKLLADPWAVDLGELWEQALHNPDPAKRKLYDALWEYVIGKRQNDIISEQFFTI